MIGSKPVVCVTSSTNNAVFPEATREIQMTMTYCDAIYSAGGVPVVGPEHGAEELSELCDALLLTGGRDVEPSLYGAEVLNDTVKTDPPRTEFELALIRGFTARKKPIMYRCSTWPSAARSIRIWWSNAAMCIAIRTFATMYTPSRAAYCMSFSARGSKPTAPIIRP